MYQKTKEISTEPCDAYDVKTFMVRKRNLQYIQDGDSPGVIIEEQPNLIVGENGTLSPFACSERRAMISNTLNQQFLTVADAPAAHWPAGAVEYL